MLRLVSLSLPTWRLQLNVGLQVYSLATRPHCMTKPVLLINGCRCNISPPYTYTTGIRGPSAAAAAAVARAHKAPGAPPALIHAPPLDKPLAGQCLSFSCPACPTGSWTPHRSLLEHQLCKGRCTALGSCRHLQAGVAKEHMAPACVAARAAIVRLGSQRMGKRAGSGHVSMLACWQADAHVPREPSAAGCRRSRRDSSYKRSPAARRWRATT